MTIICMYNHDLSTIGLFLGTDDGRSLCLMAHFGWLSVINRSGIGAIDPSGNSKRNYSVLGANYSRRPGRNF